MSPRILLSATESIRNAERAIFNASRYIEDVASDFTEYILIH